MRTFYRGVKALGNAVGWLMQPVYNTALGRALFDMHKGMLMQGDFGKFAREYFDRGREKEWIKEMDKSVLEREIVKGSDKSQLLKAATLGRLEYDRALRGEDGRTH